MKSLFTPPSQCWHVGSLPIPRDQVDLLKPRLPDQINAAFLHGIPKQDRAYEFLTNRTGLLRWCFGNLRSMGRHFLGSEALSVICRDSDCLYCALFSWVAESEIIKVSSSATDSSRCYEPRSNDARLRPFEDLRKGKVRVPSSSRFLPTSS